MSRSQTTKTIAKRIDLEYFKAPGAILRSKRILAVVLSLVAALWIGAYELLGDLRPYNPGPVATAHAHFEHNCFQCHDGDGKGSYLRSVSDNACLKCHDGAAHHPTLKSLTSADGQSSTACASCHVEHRGRTALAATRDQHCTQCHGSLSLASHMQYGKTTVTPSPVTAFAVGSHPPFGRELLVKDKLVDSRTQLKFNHNEHFKQFAEMSANCAMCHSTGDAVSSGLAAARAERLRLSDGKVRLPPYDTDKDRQPDWQRSADRRYMLPVSYARHCQECHPLRLDMPSGNPLPIPHERMELVRNALATVPASLLDEVTRMPEVERKKKLVRGAGLKKKEITEREWIDDQLKKLSDSAEKKIDLLQTKPAQWDAVVAKPVAGPSDHLARVEYSLFYAVGERCTKCHSSPIQQSPATVTAQALPKIIPLETAPTGIPTLPRRWFVHSTFNHDAHRNEKCIACHTQAAASTQTTDLIMPRMESCIACHHPDTRTQKGATVMCASCHVFHDRRLDNPPPSARK